MTSLGSWQAAPRAASRSRTGALSRALVERGAWRRHRRASTLVSSAFDQLSNKKRADPNVATFLTWFVPGAGHLYAGRLGLGLAIFAIVEGLYFLGLNLSQGMSFQYLDLELRTRAATVLTPEFGNLGGMLWQMNQYGFGDLRPWPEHVRIGSWLAAISGMANVVAMAHVHLLARTNKLALSTKPALGIALTWICPGLGHFMQGRRLRGALVFVLLIGLFVVGTLLAEGSNLSRERHFYYWSGQFLLGLPALVAELAWGDMHVMHDISYVDAGLVFGCVAGLLNVLAMIDVYAFSEAKLLGLPPKTAAHPKEEASAESSQAGSAPGGVPPSPLKKVVSA
jgi:TM2 domain-containing membrane protein YozV